MPGEKSPGLCFGGLAVGAAPLPVRACPRAKRGGGLQAPERNLRAFVLGPAAGLRPSGQARARPERSEGGYAGENLQAFVLGLAGAAPLPVSLCLSRSEARGREQCPERNLRAFVWGLAVGAAPPPSRARPERSEGRGNARREISGPLFWGLAVGAAPLRSSPGLSRAKRGKGQCPERNLRAFVLGARRRGCALPVEPRRGNRRGRSQGRLVSFPGAAASSSRAHRTREFPRSEPSPRAFVVGLAVRALRSLPLEPRPASNAPREGATDEAAG